MVDKLQLIGHKFYLVNEMNVKNTQTILQKHRYLYFDEFN